MGWLIQMCKFNPKNDSRRIDPCMKEFIKNFKLVLHPGFKVVACCCGHKRYSMTLLVKALSSGKVIDVINGKYIPRKRNFYRKDKQGYYYIPEVVK